jgi:hypothetical protein
MTSARQIQAERFTPDHSLPCPDCGEDGTEFYDHLVVGWLCPDCYGKVQRACEELARFKVSA